MQTGAPDGDRLTRDEQRMVADLARAVVAELAPEELGLFEQRSKAFFRRVKRSPRDPLAFGGTDEIQLVTSAALAGAQTAVVLLLFRFADVAGETVSGVVNRLVARLRRRPSVPVADQVAAKRWQSEDLRDVHDAVVAVLPAIPGREGIAKAIVGHLVLRTSPEEHPSEQVPRP